jgi:hypothetical protein
MKTMVESICCRERPELLKKIQEEGEDRTCIILHPGFTQGCTNPYALEIAYKQYVQQYKGVPDVYAVNQAS